MSWRKLDDDGKDLCRSLDHILDGVQALKDSIRRGDRLDDRGEMKVDFKDIWCPELFANGRSLTDAPLDVQETRASLRRMKDAKNTLSSLLESIDETIKNVASVTAIDFRAAGLASLPDDVLAIIFEMCVDMNPSKYSGNDYTVRYSTRISSVCQRFRQLALQLPDLWKSVSLSFPDAMLFLYKERCPSPVVYMNHRLPRSFEFSKMLDVVHPSHQWRELHLRFWDGDHVQQCLEGLYTVVGQTPFTALEYLSICDNLTIDGDFLDEDSDQWTSIYLPGGQSPTISSWQMPKLTRLKLRNILSHPPLHCENVTWFCFELCNVEESLRLEVLQKQLQSMPKLQTLSVTISLACPFDSIESSHINHSPLTPSLTNLELKIGEDTPDLMISQILALVNTKQLIRFKLSLEGRLWKDTQFDEWVNAIFPRTAKAFANVKHFTLDATHNRGSYNSYDRIFTSLPNAQEVSLILPHHAEIGLGGNLVKRGAFRHLRSLIIEVVHIDTGSGPLEIGVGRMALNTLIKRLHREGSEGLEVRNRTSYSMSEGKANLQKLLGEKLRWIDYGSD
ncbi:hypothetical protein SCHPADRAFT_944788 [Schizopora paradoxa]|uniref:Uncharacterized protein n=1 Tax=Schizopora paradoxa TaxID=27342 RepID=A0A0H2R852_9AGAM|nr:hypothetical protein SCHPADRAFT_944788 [Schizopora paradoxa]